MAKNKKNISRRTFLSNMGTGIAGSYLATLPLKTEKATKNDSSPDSQKLSLSVNGKKYDLSVEPETTLVELLRETLHLTGTKISCNRGECGACTVLLNGKPVYSCHMLAMDAAGKEVTTIEGLSVDGKPGPVQKAFIDNDGLQCGFCTPGQIMSAHALLQRTPSPSHDEILEGMSGNLCRCGAYPNIIKSVKNASLSIKTTG